MNFHDLKLPVQKRFSTMTKLDLFCVDATGDELWEQYLASFPPGTDPIYRKRTEHDCSCCRNFIRNVGGVVAIVDGRYLTLWDRLYIKEPAYQAVADAMDAFVRSRAIDRNFLHWEKAVGVDKNVGKSSADPTDSGVTTYSHFFVEIPWAQNRGRNFFCPAKDIPSAIGAMKSVRDLFYRGLTTLTLDALETVSDLIEKNSLYRGEQYKHAVDGFLAKKREFDALPEGQRELYAWEKYASLPDSVSRIRNTAIGTLLQELSEGTDLVKAVNRFETTIMAPSNYQRPTALVSNAQKEAARAKVEELGLTDALDRRHARLTDISVADILFVDSDARKSMKDDVFSRVPTKTVAARALDRVDTVNIETFVKDILPGIVSLEVMLENRHVPNLVSLIAPQHKASKPLFKWGNGFSWTYNGEAADSIKERVKRAGGNVTGDLCCRLAWFNNDDLDFHMVEPSHISGRRGHEIYYACRRSLSPSGGTLDVDANGGDGIVQSRLPVENIFYSKATTMRAGEYRLFVRQFARRETIDFGFEVEIEWLGEINRFTYAQPVRGDVEVASITLNSARKLEIKSSLPSLTASRTVWGLKTQDWHRVTTMMLSPNYWVDGRGTGNKHFMFMLDGAINNERPRGFFNEFLIEDLAPHGRVLEMVGGMSKVEPSTDQLSGLGFSSTQRNELLVRTKGNYAKTLKLTF